MSVATLVGLPRELKWLIFDEFFAAFTIRPPVLDTYALPNQWPEHPDLRVLLALVSTCKELRAEALSYFEQRCLPTMTFYFDNTPSVYRFYQSVYTRKPEYLSIQFSLRTRCNLVCPNTLAAENEVTHQFMKSNMEVLDWEPLGLGWHIYTGPGEEGWYKWEVMGGLRSHVAKIKGTSIIDAVHISDGGHLKLVHRGIRKLAMSDYCEMTGTLGALDWRCYDKDAVEYAYLEALSVGGEILENNNTNSYLIGMEKLVSALCELER